MGKRLSKSKLLAEVAEERRALDDVINSLTSRQKIQAGVTAAGWSVKDILGHLIGWQKMNLTWYETSKGGKTPQVPAPGYSWKDIRALNAKIYRAHHRRALVSVLSDYQSHHERILELISKAPDADFARVGRYDWTGPTWTLSDYIRANTASHYRWARKHIRKWLQKERKRLKENRD